MGKILVTGCAGFIGSSLVEKLLILGSPVVGIDNMNDYYSPSVKENNLKPFLENPLFTFYREDICNFLKLSEIFTNEKPDKVIHLAARAGVRPSLVDPLLYARVNVIGTLNLIYSSRLTKVNQFIFASSSSVYGNSSILPFSENDLCQNIVSPYGSSKRSAELFIESLLKDSNINCTILRFFTVYGPKGRPDMSPYIFTKAILENESISLFGSGDAERDFTFIDDIIDGIILTIKKPNQFEIVNLGNNKPVKISALIELIELLLNKKASIKYLDKQKGDTEKTWANISKAKQLFGWEPKVNIKQGMSVFVKWLQESN